MKQTAHQTKRIRANSSARTGAPQNLAKRLAEVQALRELVRGAEIQRKQRLAKN
jgi:hypothetical protein